MRLAEDPEMAQWIEGVAGTSEDFEWDDGNRSKNTKHGVTVAEVESLLSAPVLFAGRKERQVYEEAISDKD